MLHTVEEAAEEADVIMILVPDESQTTSLQRMKSNQYLQQVNHLFSHTDLTFISIKSFRQQM